MNRDVRYMRRAIKLSRKGYPAPNPHVGCVIVQGERVVGEGYHDHAGGPHAEVVALESAGAASRGSEVYVTLEPCNHFGRTPPCADALIQAGVRRVVAACPDPNPTAAGGLARLASAGVETTVGVLQEEAESENRFFLSAIRRGRPYVLGKSAVTLDGRTALPSGESKWITGEEARAAAHRLRADCGAVLVGRRTVELDDPLLTARIPGVVNQPLRIVLDPANRLPASAKVFSPGAETWHITGRIDLKALLDRLLLTGHIGLLVEGGANTLGRFLAQGLIDELRLFTSPRILCAGPNWIEGLSARNLQAAPEFAFESTKKYGPDIELRLVRNRQ